MSSPDLIRIAPGDVVDDFEIGELIAEGGSSATFRATHRTLAREVALKFVYPAVFADDRAAIEAAQAGARRVARLEHPGIAPVFAAGSHEGGLYIASSMPKGRTLADLGARRAITPVEAAKVLADVAAALQAAHEQGVVHRDLRPDCITMDRWGNGVVHDFGVTRTSGRTGLLTRAEILESMRYTAPELVLGKPAAPASDVYGLAAVAVWCLTGAPPYSDRRPAEYVLFRTTAPAPVLADAEGTPAAELNAVLAAAMALDPAARPGPLELATALTDAVAALPAGVRGEGCPLTASEVAVADSPPPPAQARPGAAISGQDTTRIEHRRPLPPKPDAQSGPVPWATWVACAMVALSIGLAGLLAGRASVPEPGPPVRVGAFTLDAGDTWTRSTAPAPGGVQLSGAAGESVTLAVADDVRLPGDPLAASLLPDRKATPRAATSGTTGLVTYTGTGARVVARPTTESTLFAVCSEATSAGRCTALVVHAKGPGKDLPVLASGPVSEQLHDMLKAVEQAIGVAAVDFRGERSKRATAAQGLSSEIADAVSGFSAKGVDPGTAAVIARLTKALTQQARGLEDLANALDKDSSAAFGSAAADIRAGHRKSVAVLDEFKRAGYAVRS